MPKANQKEKDKKHKNRLWMLTIMKLNDEQTKTRVRNRSKEENSTYPTQQQTIVHNNSPLFEVPLQRAVEQRLHTVRLGRNTTDFPNYLFEVL